MFPPNIPCNTWKMPRYINSKYLSQVAIVLIDEAMISVVIL